MWKPYEIGRDFSRKRLEPGLSDLPNHQNHSMKSKLIHAPQSNPTLTLPRRISELGPALARVPRE
jgi:hypothetical protein